MKVTASENDVKYEVITEIDVVSPKELQDADGNQVSFDEYLDLLAEATPATKFDGNSPFVFPRLGLTEQEFETFLLGLASTADIVYSEPGATSWSEHWMLQLPKDG